jgi:3-hydroxyacyl-[acyl-carrier-protein] dehydratase
MTINFLKRLHQRAPYLLVDEVIEHSKDKIHMTKVPTMNDYYLQGHFPGVPVVPGAMMQEMTTQAAGLLIAEYYSPVPDYDSEKTLGYALGVLRTVHHAKYKSFARPQDILQIKVELVQVVENAYRFKGHIEIDNNKIMFNEFTLVNISAEKLIGNYEK